MLAQCGADSLILTHCANNDDHTHVLVSTFIFKQVDWVDASLIFKGTV